MGLADTDQLQKQRKLTVQAPPDAKSGLGTLHWQVAWTRTFILPTWATYEREVMLRQYDRHEYNALWQGASGGQLKKLAAVPWEITTEDDSKKGEIAYWQSVLRQANFGDGWGNWLKKGGRDYLRQDKGWFIEVIAAGDPMKPPVGPVAGIAHLDSLRCEPTGDPEFPVRYFNQRGELHLMHRTRVIQLVDMPDGDEFRPGYGLCALSRAISIVQRQIWEGRYIEQNLDDKPPPGIVYTNIAQTNVENAIDNYTRRQTTDERPFWGKQLFIYGIDPTATPVFNTVNFSQAPEKFSWQEYVNIDVNALALALGVDKQELWELSGGNLGSGAQSYVLAQKARGKTFGDMLSSVERAINDILPEYMTFEFRFRDPEEDKEKAALAAQWQGVATGLKAAGEITADEGRQLLANQVEAIRDVVAPDGVLRPYAEVQAEENPTPEPPPQQPPAPEGMSQSQIMAEDNTPLDVLPEISKGWDESKHPRADDGKFGEGTGEGSEEGTDSTASEETPSKVQWTNDKPRKPGKDGDYTDFGSFNPREKLDVEAVTHADELSDKQVKGLTKKQKGAIETYSTSAYQDINRHLRTGTPLDAKNKRTIEELKTTLDGSKLPENLVLYRGMSLPKESLKTLKPGGKYEETAFVSTSMSQQIASNFSGRGNDLDIVMRIKAPKGTKALAVSSASGITAEREVLMPPGTAFTITAVKKKGKRYYVEAVVASAGGKMLRVQWRAKTDDDEPPTKFVAIASSIKWLTSEDKASATKDIQAVRLDFEADFEDALAAARADDVTRRRFGIILRALISKYGRRAYNEGLITGGVEDGLSEEDLPIIDNMIAAQSMYVTSLGEAVYGDGIGDDQAAGKAVMWWNKSLAPFYQEGLIAADKNGNYEFAGDDGEESCKDCRRLKGQVHRLVDYAKRNLIPPTSQTECGGWNCKHILVKTTSKARGSW